MKRSRPLTTEQVWPGTTSRITVSGPEWRPYGGRFQEGKWQFTARRQKKVSHFNWEDKWVEYWEEQSYVLEIQPYGITSNMEWPRFFCYQGDDDYIHARINELMIQRFGKAWHSVVFGDPTIQH